MVQMILARRRTPWFGVEFSSAFGVLSFNCSHQAEGFLLLKCGPAEAQTLLFSHAGGKGRSFTTKTGDENRFLSTPSDPLA